MLFREHCQRNIRAHGLGRLRPGLGHGQHGAFHILVGPAKSFVEPVAHRLGILLQPLFGRGQLGELYQLQIQPFPEGMVAGIGLFDLVVKLDPALHHVRQQHPPRLQPGALDDLFRGKVHDAHLGGQNQPLVVGQIVAQGAQTVAVQRRANGVAVREKKGGGAVPGLHHGGVVVIHVPAAAAHVPLAVPGLGDGDHHRQGQLHAGEHEKFQGVVQHGGVGACGVYHRQHLVHVVFQQPGVHGLLPGQHTVNVALNGVDLSVVEKKPVGVGPLPAGEGVGGKAGVYQRQGRTAALVLQIGVEAAQLLHKEHALVYDGAAGERGNVGV